MHIERRLHFYIGLAFIIGIAVFSYLSYMTGKKEAETSLLASAEHVRSVLMATRRVYHHQFLQSGLPLNEKTIGFLPAHALNRISKDLVNWDKTGFSFNNVSDQPRNTAQKADTVEMLAIEYFRKNPTAELRFSPFTASNGEPYYHYSRPIWVEQYCLQCHGERSKAPETVQKLYDTAYDYKVGDLRGILSIKVPASAMQEQLISGVICNLVWACGTMVLLWIAISFIVRRDILLPLSSLKSGINRLASGTFKGSVGDFSGEFGEIGRAFDNMAVSLEQERLLLASSEQRFRYLATTATDTIILADEDGAILFWNEGAERIFGYEKNEIIGKPITILIPDRFIAAHQSSMERVRNGGEGKSFGHSLEVIGLNRDGEEVQLEVSLNSWISDNCRYFVAIMRDIRARKAIEADLVQARSQAEASSRAKSQFLANMSHEIRTPMNAILGLTYLLEQTNLDLIQRDYVKKTKVSAASLLGILNDILDLSKVQAGKMELIEEPFRFDDLMNGLATIAATNARDKDIEVLFDIGPNTPLTLIGDQQRLQQVLTNLVSNAIKFTQRGEVVLSVEVTSSDHHNVDLLFRVRDTGIGISSENQQKIFEVFSQADNTTSRRFGGSGLGLAISRRLVELAGGRIWCESTPGQGSTFFVALRFGRSSLMLDEPGRQQTISTDLKVLIADDNSTARQVMTTMVATFGWRSVVASSGQQVLEEIDKAMKSEPFDLLLLDWSMPDVGGNEIFHHIKSHQAPEDVPLILIVTTFEYERVRRDSGGESLIRAVLTKPVTPSSLLDAVTLARPLSANVQPLPPPASRSTNLPLVGSKLLVVEDNTINQVVARRILESVGASVTVAADGIKALEFLSAGHHHYDAVLMDIQMPGMDGYDATRAIRNDLGLVDLPIIAMTANAMVSDREQCLTAGMNDHIGKPFVVEQMVGVIKKHTKHHIHIDQLSHSSLITGVSPGYFSEVNVKEALLRTMGDRDLLNDLMNDFAQTYDDVSNLFNRLLTEGKLKELARKAHELRGVSANLGAYHLARVSKTLQVSAERGDIDQAKQACDEVRALLPTVIFEARRIADGGSFDADSSTSARNAKGGQDG